MKKTLLTLFTTIAVCGMSYSQVYAQIDVSVFENKADYDVDMDDFDDTGEISFVGGDNMPSGTVIGNPDGDSGYISGELFEAVHIPERTDYSLFWHKLHLQ